MCTGNSQRRKWLYIAVMNLTFKISTWKKQVWTILFNVTNDFSCPNHHLATWQVWETVQPHQIRTEIYLPLRNMWHELPTTDGKKLQTQNLSKLSNLGYSIVFFSLSCFLLPTWCCHQRNSTVDKLNWRSDKSSSNIMHFYSMMLFLILVY